MDERLIVALGYGFIGFVRNSENGQHRPNWQEVVEKLKKQQKKNVPIEMYVQPGQKNMQYNTTDTSTRAGKIRSPSRHLRPKNIFGDQIMGSVGQIGD